MTLLLQEKDFICSHVLRYRNNLTQQHDCKDNLKAQRAFYVKSMTHSSQHTKKGVTRGKSLKDWSDSQCREWSEIAFWTLFKYNFIEKVKWELTDTRWRGWIKGRDSYLDGVKTFDDKRKVFAGGYSISDVLAYHTPTIINNIIWSLNFRHRAIFLVTVNLRLQNLWSFSYNFRCRKLLHRNGRDVQKLRHADFWALR